MSRGGISASTWPEGDRLFRSDPGWRGADAAYSVPLSNGRTLWLFGDTFIGPTRETARMIHNTIGIQDRPDPAAAGIELHHGGTLSDPEPFFPAPAGTWLWPMAGSRTDVGVVVFFMRVRSARPDLDSVIDAWRAEGSLRFFEVVDWEAVVIRNPDDPVERWDVQPLQTPPAVNRIMPGAGAVVHGDHLYAYGWRDGHELRPGLIRRRPRYRGHWRPRLAFIVRWPVEEVLSGLTGWEWWTGSGWDADPSRAVPVVEDPATEFTVHHDPVRGGLVLVESAGWIAGIDGRRALRALRIVKRLPAVSRLLSFLKIIRVSICLRFAAAPQGPWSDPVRVLAPEARRDDLVYAGKAHPQLEGADLVCTYAQIARTADRTLREESLYYPRFVRIRFR